MLCLLQVYNKAIPLLYIYVYSKKFFPIIVHYKILTIVSGVGFWVFGSSLLMPWMARKAFSVSPLSAEVNWRKGKDPGLAIPGLPSEVTLRLESSRIATWWASLSRKFGSGWLFTADLLRPLHAMVGFVSDLKRIGFPVPVIIVDCLILWIFSLFFLPSTEAERRGLSHISTALHKYSQSSMRDMFSCKAYLFIFRQIIEVVTNSHVGLPWLSRG